MLGFSTDVGMTRNHGTYCLEKGTKDSRAVGDETPSLQFSYLMSLETLVIKEKTWQN